MGQEQPEDLRGEQSLGGLDEGQELRGYQEKGREWDAAGGAGDDRKHLKEIRDGYMFRREVDQSTKADPSLPQGLRHPWLRTSWNTGGHQV